ncbi:hypothetical protein PUNSTDRAFT_138386 [Punctularia strigosozonata HHB-11173 SS5]|uniref:Uncharacterized protein n=1 Tax=Punctularia strigosozonata (strain HHB-11173) TaxID=741275 RepID=R7S4N2_PUNST|nr:uncharacterized protein PUNSTDRAFT_138386 [Punctularia strigosozonata HHB-11173 SS5]EIN04742.1 hypothetical protein PUNSTDRAFT_138386 [Punctularia strigosozonata HHB-11173 SS5]
MSYTQPSTSMAVDSGLRSTLADEMARAERSGAGTFRDLPPEAVQGLDIDIEMEDVTVPAADATHPPAHDNWPQIRQDAIELLMHYYSVLKRSQEPPAQFTYVFFF